MDIYNRYSLVAKKNKFHDSKYGIYSKPKGSKLNVFKKSIIEKNTFKNCTYGIYNYLTNNNKITYNKFHDSKYGIYNRGNNSLIKKNTLNNVKDFGIVLRGNKNKVLSNNIKATNSKQFSKISGISIRQSAKNNIISKNKITKFNSGIENSGYKTTIKNNLLAYNLKFGVYMYLNSKYTNLAQNTLQKNKIGIYNTVKTSQIYKNKIKSNKIGLITAKKVKYNTNYFTKNSKKVKYIKS
nr:NosD domain-containing protein [Methanobrevibacter arboriphilus]